MVCPIRHLIFVFFYFFICNRTSIAQDTLRPGNLILEDVSLPLGSVSFESIKIHQGTRTPVNKSVLTIRQGIEEGVPAYEVTILHQAAGRGDSALTTIVVRWHDLALLRHKVNASRDSAAVLYSHGFPSGWVVLPDKPILLIDRKISQPVFPVDRPVPWLLGSLPLKENFRAVLSRYSMWQDREVFDEIHVLGSETLKRNGKNIECWKVDNGPFAIPGYRAFRWVEKQSKKVVQTVLRGNDDQPEYWTFSD
jgi:hypothetical protein